MTLCTLPITNPKTSRRGEPCGRPEPCPLHTAGPGEISAAPIAELLETAIADLVERYLTGAIVGQTGGGIDRLAAQMASSGHWTHDGAARLVHAVRTGGRLKVGTDTADKILTALGMTEIWHTHPAFVEAAERELDAAAADGFDETEIDSCRTCSRAVEWNRGDAGMRDGDDVYCSICWARRKHGFPFGPWKRADLLELYIRYVREGVTIMELVEPLWQARGYSNKRTATSSVVQAWKRNEWPMRRRHESRTLGRKLRGPRLLTTRSLSETEARALHPLHWEQWRSINSLAKEHHGRLGLTQSALCSQLSYTWKLLELPRHDRIEMCVRVSTVHGMKRRKGNSAAYKRFQAQQKGEQYDEPCQELTVKGKPCTARAMLGKTHCQNHDPARREQIAEHLAAIRLRSPLRDPNRIEPLPPLQEEMRAYFDWAGGWLDLAAATGLENKWLSKLSTTRQQHNVSRETAALLRTAIEELTFPHLARAA